jgi:hypothetical protein
MKLKKILAWLVMAAAGAMVLFILGAVVCAIIESRGLILVFAVGGFFLLGLIFAAIAWASEVIGS